MWRLLILLLFSPSIMSETITVSVDTDGKSEYQIRQEGKQKVSIEMLDRMPAIISGQEILINGNLSTRIKSLTLSAVDVVPIKESWDRKAQRYTLTAEATVDEAMVKGLFEEMKKSAQMKKLLKESSNRIAELQAQLNEKQYSKPRKNNTTKVNNDPKEMAIDSGSHNAIIAGFAQQVELINAGLVDKAGVFKFRKEATVYFVHALFTPYKDSYSIAIERNDARQTTTFTLTPSKATSRYYDAIVAYNESIPHMQFTHMCLGTRTGSDRQKMRSYRLTFKLDIKNEYKGLLEDPVIYPC